MDWYDVVVVGGGPAGAVAARAAAEESAKVLVLERAPNAPARCAGLISPRAFDFLGIPQPLLLREIHGTRIYPPTGKALELSSPKVKGLVIDRAALNELLLFRAEEAGATVWRGAAALGLTGSVLRTTSGKVGFEVLIGADGPISGVASWTGLARPQEILVGIQATVRAAIGKGDRVEVFLGREVAPGLFAWAIPAQEGEVRVGLATSEGRRANALLARLLGKRFPKAEVVEKTAGLIPIGPPANTAGERVLLVGAAAAQIKPLSGGGLFFGPLCAKIAGKLAACGLAAISDYESRWRKEIGREITFGLLARRTFLRLSDRDLDHIVSACHDPVLLQFMAEQGDIDFPSRLVRKARTQLRLWPHLRRLFAQLLQVN